MSWRWPALGLMALFAAALLWLAGFAMFEREARFAAPEPAVSDGIVVLTGGAGRIETALRLLADGRAPRLLVSGVGGGGDLAEIMRHLDAAPRLPADQVTLGRDATDTVGNAAETAAWVRRNDIRTLIVVTAGYHMPRALREMALALPGVTLRPMPVQPPALQGRERTASVRLLATEFDKLLAAWSGIDRLLKGRFRP